MPDELETLRARCARLRAALAGVVKFNNPGAMDFVFEIDKALAEMSRAGPYYDPRETYWRKIALEVLRETAEEVPHAD